MDLRELRRQDGLGYAMLSGKRGPRRSWVEQRPGIEPAQGISFSRIIYVWPLDQKREFVSAFFVL